MESLLIVFGQYLTEIRMCDLDSLFGPVSQGFPCLPFSNHLVHNRQPLSYVSPPFYCMIPLTLSQEHHAPFFTLNQAISHQVRKIKNKVFPDK